MKVICNSIGSVPSHSNAPKTECSMCGASKPHDINSCEPCPWNKDATCMPIPDDKSERLQSESRISIGVIGSGVKVKVHPITMKSINKVLQTKQEFLNNILKSQDNATDEK
jgi:hypothetical protein